MMEALKFAKDNPKVKKFVIYNLSRLTRLKNDFHLIHKSLKSLEIDICSASEQLDFGSPTGRLVANFLVDINEFYSDNLSDVVNENKKTNAEKGRWNGGPAPFGLQKVGDSFIADGYKAEAIKLAFNMAMEGKGPYVIAKKLNNLGIKTETGVDWSPRRIRYVLTNPTYAGRQKWKGELYDLADCEALVSWDQFDYIQKTLFGTEKVWRGKERQLLSSVLFCPVCGNKMHARFTNTKSGRRYVCSQKNTSGGCNSPNVDLYSLNDAVIELIGELSKDRFSETEILTELSEPQNNQDNTSEVLLDEYRKLESAKQQLFDDYYLHSKIPEDLFSSTMNRYESRQKEINKLLEKIPLPLQKGFGGYDDVIDQFSQAIVKLQDQEQRQSIELLIEKIIPGEKVQVFFKWGEVKIIHPTERKKFKGCYVYFFKKITA